MHAHFLLWLAALRTSSEQLGTFKEFVKTFPEIDTPEIFGLHPNADLTFRVKEVNALFLTLGNTQPKVFYIAIIPTGTSRVTSVLCRSCFSALGNTQPAVFFRSPCLMPDTCDGIVEVLCRYVGVGDISSSHILMGRYFGFPGVSPWFGGEPSLPERLYFDARYGARSSAYIS